MINLFRLDNKVFNGILGGKAQLAYELSKGQKGVITCGSRHSQQVLSYAKMCDKLNIPCEVHIPQGEDTDITTELKQMNCIINYEKVGYNNVLNAHARDNAKNKGYKFIQLGMLCEDAFYIIANNVKDLLIQFPNTDRLVVPVGSGTTLIGILKGLQILNRTDINVIGVMVGLDANKNVDKFMDVKYENLELIKSNLKYEKPYIDNVINGIELNEYYEAKCIPYLKENDTLYIVAR